jgi:hypothetical protein
MDQGEQCEEEKGEVLREEGKDLARNWGCEFFEVSGKGCQYGRGALLYDTGVSQGRESTR